MSTTHETRLNELQQRIGDIDASIAKLDSEYEDCAAAFDGKNGRDALKRAEAIERSQEALRREKTLAIAAQGKIQEQQQAEQQEAEQSAKHQKQIEARQFGDVVMRLNIDIDRQFASLVQLLDQRANALRALANTGIGNSEFINKLATKPAATRAAAASGLGKFVSIENVATSSLQPLASANPVLLAIGSNGSNGSNGSRPRVRLEGNGAANNNGDKQ